MLPRYVCALHAEDCLVSELLQGRQSRRTSVSRPTKSTAQYFIRFISLAVLLLFANVARGQNTISTVAGGAPPSGVSPTAAPIEGPEAMARDCVGKSLRSE